MKSPSGLACKIRSIGKGKTMSSRFFAAAIAVAAPAAFASAELTLLDIPSGSGESIDWSSSQGLAEMPFSITSQDMSFKQLNFATLGNIRAWDSELGVDKRGKVWFTAAEDVALTSLSFDISGLSDYDATAWVKIYLDGQLYEDYTWDFEGNSTAFRMNFEFDEPVNEVRLTMKNLTGYAHTGIDNIELGAINIPAPGAVALLGLAGLVGGRRRRH